MRVNLKEKRIWLIVGPILVGLFLYFILIPIEYILGILVIYYILLLTLPLYKNLERKDDMKRAWEYVCKWWWDFRKEDISSLFGKGFVRYFGSDKFIAFVVNRGQSGGLRDFMPLVIVVKVNGLEIVDWDDKPSMEKLENPFMDISPTLFGVPSPSVKPELEPLLKARSLSKKLVEKKEGEEEEVKSEFEGE